MRRPAVGATCSEELRLPDLIEEPADLGGEVYIVRAAEADESLHDARPTEAGGLRVGVDALLVALAERHHLADGDDLLAQSPAAVAAPRLGVQVGSIRSDRH